MEAERNRRKQLLDTQAQINVAEGNKQRVILESEGHVSCYALWLKIAIIDANISHSKLEAKSNEADAYYKTVVRDAEARSVDDQTPPSSIETDYYRVGNNKH
jgi:hypothetical protein